MNTEEHLNKIREKCRELLAIAEKRTQGWWTNAGENIYTASHPSQHIANSNSANFRIGNSSNAAFIAACAGPAEAGWRATIAAIDWIVSIRRNEGPEGSYEMLNNILSAWPEELL